jgi:hypothetical protein
MLGHDLDRALELLRLPVGDVGEHAAARRLFDELRVLRLEQSDHRAGRLVHDLRDQLQRVLGALAQADQRHVGPLGT